MLEEKECLRQRERNASAEEVEAMQVKHAALVDEVRHFYLLPSIYLQIIWIRSDFSFTVLRWMNEHNKK